ncbi:MAG: tryptophan--tRNA ligase [Acidobacteriota bacterium]|nr:tryptophan--tRNA ligase [Acidobacteriota bacterium]
MPEQATSSSRPRVLSGMRPTGKLHLGNYMGALANWVKLQDQYECYFFIADLHALTTDYADTSQIAPNSLEVALDFLGAGLDPERSTIFVQSQVTQHYELPLLLGMITPLGWLERVPSYKEMIENLAHKDLTTYGFLGYPVLMASDILLYQPQFVPVGQDQQAHVELTREIARRFNMFYPKIPMTYGMEFVRHEELVAEIGEEIARRTIPDQMSTFQRPVGASDLPHALNPEYVLPEPKVLLTPSPKLPGTDGRKMSKSYGNTIQMTDPEPVVRQKLKTMVTDPARIRRTDKGDPDKCPVGDLHKVFSTAETLAKVYDGCRSAGIGCIECKGWAADALVQVLSPIQERRARLTEPHVKEILRAGSERAQARAGQTMEEVHSAMQLARMD